MKTISTLSIFSLAIVLLLFSGCRKEVLKEENSNVISATQTHCYNGVKDADETGIDCGGSCNACPEISIPCTIANNSLVISSSPTTITNISSSVSGGDFIITATAGSKNITIKVEDPVSTLTSYDLDYPFTSSGSAVVNITNMPNAVSNYIYISGNIYFNSSGSGYKVVLCGGAYYDTFGSGHGVSLSITVP